MPTHLGANPRNHVNHDSCSSLENFYYYIYYYSHIIICNIIIRFIIICDFLQYYIFQEIFYNIWWENYNKFHLQQKNLLGCCIVFWENSNNGSQNQARKLLSVIRNLPSRYLRRYEVYMLRRYLRSLQQNYIKLHQVYNMQATFEGIILHILFNITTGHDFAYSSIYV